MRILGEKKLGCHRPADGGLTTSFPQTGEMEYPTINHIPVPKLFSVLLE